MSKRYGIQCGEIDVAMIVYNEAGLISEALVALVKAGFDSFVVLDMQSTDDTLSLMAHLLGDCMKYFSYPRSSLLKHGYAEARNVCAAHCQRRWVLFVDADEVLIDGVTDGFVEVAYAEKAFDLYSIERRNLSSATPMSKTIGSVERHNRMYMPSPAIHWSGYIHEELHGRRPLSYGETQLVFDHYSAVKKAIDQEAKNGLYATMLLRGLRDPDVRSGTNTWHYDVFVPENIDLLRQRACSYVAAANLNAIYHPDYIGDVDIKEIITENAFFVTFAGKDATESSIDLADVRTLHSTSARKWTGRDDRAHWCEWRHPGEGSRSLSSILSSFSASNWERFIKPGSTSIDIGGHSGDTAIPLALFSYDAAAQEGGHVIVVEPNPAVRKVLEVNLALNTNLANFHFLAAAITREDVQEIELADHGNAECNGGVVQGGISETLDARLNDIAVVRYKARGVSMETLFSEAKKVSTAPISFIKIDCEGYDKEIIRPCRELFATEKPVLFVEWFAWFSPEDDTDLFKVIADVGYVPFDPISLLPAKQGNRIFDLICIHRDSLNAHGLSVE